MLSTRAASSCKQWPTSSAALPAAILVYSSAMTHARKEPPFPPRSAQLANPKPSKQLLPECNHRCFSCNSRAFGSRHGEVQRWHWRHCPETKQDRDNSKLVMVSYSFSTSGQHIDFGTTTVGGQQHRGCRHNQTLFFKWFRLTPTPTSRLMWSSYYFFLLYYFIFILLHHNKFIKNAKARRFIQPG